MLLTYSAVTWHGSSTNVVVLPWTARFFVVIFGSCLLSPKNLIQSGNSVSLTNDKVEHIATSIRLIPQYCGAPLFGRLELDFHVVLIHAHRFVVHLLTESRIKYPNLIPFPIIDIVKVNADVVTYNRRLQSRSRGTDSTFIRLKINHMR